MPRSSSNNAQQRSTAALLTQLQYLLDENRLHLRRSHDGDRLYGQSAAVGELLNLHDLLDTTTTSPNNNEMHIPDFHSLPIPEISRSPPNLLQEAFETTTTTTLTTTTAAAAASVEQQRRLSALVVTALDHIVRETVTRLVQERLTSVVLEFATLMQRSSLPLLAPLLLLSTEQILFSGQQQQQQHYQQLSCYQMLAGLLDNTAVPMPTTRATAWQQRQHALLAANLLQNEIQRLLPPVTTTMNPTCQEQQETTTSTMGATSSEELQVLDLLTQLHGQLFHASAGAETGSVRHSHEETLHRTTNTSAVHPMRQQQQRQQQESHHPHHDRGFVGQQKESSTKACSSMPSEGTPAASTTGADQRQLLHDLLREFERHLQLQRTVRSIYQTIVASTNTLQGMQNSSMSTTAMAPPQAQQGSSGECPMPPPSSTLQQQQWHSGAGAQTTASSSCFSRDSSPALSSLTCDVVSQQAPPAPQDDLLAANKENVSLAAAASYGCRERNLATAQPPISRTSDSLASSLTESCSFDDNTSSVQAPRSRTPQTLGAVPPSPSAAEALLEPAPTRADQVPPKVVMVPARKTAAAPGAPRQSCSTKKTSSAATAVTSLVHHQHQSTNKSLASSSSAVGVSPVLLLKSTEGSLPFKEVHYCGEGTRCKRKHSSSTAVVAHHHPYEQPFTHKLHWIVTTLEAQGKAHIASFLEEGGIWIHDRDDFVTDVLAVYFPFESWSSFRRQLQSHQFPPALPSTSNRFSASSNCGGTKTAVAFTNPFFLRGQPELCNRIICDHDRADKKRKGSR